MSETAAILARVRAAGRTALSEFESARVLGEYGVPVVEGVLAKGPAEAGEAAKRLGYPVALKLCSPEVSHKTEGGFVALGLRDHRELEEAFLRIAAKSPVPGADLLVQPMVGGRRELAIGMVRDPQFGPCVMFGLGGIWAEILGDVTFRPAPLSTEDALEMLDEIRGRAILGAVRGMEAADRDSLARCLVAVGRIGVEQQEIQAIDLNPVILDGSRPVAVDALVILSGRQNGPGPAR